MSRVRPSSSALGKSNEDLKIVNAEVAQLVERQPSKLNVASSTLVFRSWKIKRSFQNRKCGSSSVGRASAFQAECREFDPRLPLLDLKKPHRKMRFFIFFEFSGTK